MSIRNAMLGAAHQASAAKQAGRMGTISAYNPNTYCVKVFMQPSGVETGWLPIKTPWVGNSWGMQAGPSIGDQVTVSFQEGDRDGGVVLGSIYNNSYQPMVVPSGELWIQHKSGSFLKFLNNGDVQVVTSRDLLATVGRDITVTTARNVSATSTGSTHLTATTEVTIAAPIVTINAPVIALNGQIIQTTGAGTGGVQMEGPVLVNQQIKSNTEVVAITTPLHTHQHVNGGGTGNSGNPTP